MKKVTFKYILSILLLISSIKSISDGQILPAVFIILVGALIFPKVSDLIHENFSFWKNKIVRYGCYFILLAIAGSFLPSKNTNNQTQKEIIITKKAEPTSKQPIKTTTIEDIKSIKWGGKLSQKNVLKDWIQVCVIYGDQFELIKDKSADQKKLTLTSNTYRTSYPYGSGDNPLFPYQLTNSKLKVYTQSGNNLLYNYKISLSKDGKHLKLSLDNISQIYKKVINK